MDHKRILVVDDCRMSLLLIKHILGKMGIRVDSAASGDQGLKMALENNYPLIFLDLMLPTIDGFEVCRTIRESDLETQPRIIMLTAMGEAFPQDKYESSKADGVFFKPLVPSQIMEIAKATLLQMETE